VGPFAFAFAFDGGQQQGWPTEGGYLLYSQLCHIEKHSVFRSFFSPIKQPIDVKRRRITTSAVFSPKIGD
jgi:hypothetical protein